MLKRPQGLTFRIKQICGAVTADYTRTFSFDLGLHVLDYVHWRINLTYTHLLKRIFLLNTQIFFQKIFPCIIPNILSHKALLLLLTLELNIQYHRLVFGILRKRMASII